MAKNKGLHISKLDFLHSLEEFLKLHDNSFDTSWITQKELNPQNHQTRYEFTINSKNILLDAFYNKNNTITIYPIGDELSKKFGSDFKNFIQASICIQDISTGSFSCIVKEETFQDLKQYLKMLEGIRILKEEDKGVNGSIIQLISEIGDKVTLTYYKSKNTLLFQGYLMNLHVETKAFLAAYNTYVKTDVSSIRANQSVAIENAVDVLVEKCLSRSYKNLSPLLQDFLHDALKHTIVRTEFRDYGTWAFPALKALEGRIKQIFNFYGIRIGKKGFYVKDDTDQYTPMFEYNTGKYTLKSIVPIKDGNAIANLDNCYTCFAKERHGLFHTQQSLKASRRCGTPEEAEGIIYDVCQLIEKSYVDLGK